MTLLRCGSILCFLALAVVSGAPAGDSRIECGAWPPYTCERTVIYGAYTVCIWASADADAPSYYRVVTIDRGGIRLLCQDWATGLDPLSGTDIDGTGYPDVIIEDYSGGAHCCFATCVYDLAETLEAIELPPSPAGNAPGEFVDLDGDGVYEFLTADDSFAYAYCCFAASPEVLVVLRYSAAARRLVPASYLYPDLYRDEIERDTERARAAGSEGTDGGWDGTAKCEVLPLVLDYLYSGDTRSAWAALDAYYRGPDRESFRAEIERTISQSPYYAAPASDASE